MRPFLQFNLRLAFLVVTVLAIGFAIFAHRRNRERYYHELDMRFADAMSISIDDANPSSSVRQLDRAQDVYREAQAEFPNSELTRNMRWKIDFVKKIICEREYALAHPGEIMD